MTDALILSGARTPVGKLLGVFKDFSAVDLGVIVAGAVSAAAANGGKWLTASTGLTAAPSFLERRAQTATVVAALARMSPDVADRVIGLVLTAAGNAAAAANAVIGLKLTYRASYGGA